MHSRKIAQFSMLYMHGSCVLRNLSKLHKDENPDIVKKILVMPDLTPKELEKNKKLRAELKQKNKDGNFLDKECHNHTQIISDKINNYPISPLLVLF